MSCKCEGRNARSYGGCAYCLATAVYNPYSKGSKSYVLPDFGFMGVGRHSFIRNPYTAGLFEFAFAFRVLASWTQYLIDSKEADFHVSNAMHHNSMTPTQSNDPFDRRKSKTVSRYETRGIFQN